MSMRKENIEEKIVKMKNLMIDIETFNSNDISKSGVCKNVESGADP